MCRYVTAAAMSEWFKKNKKNLALKKKILKFKNVLIPYMLYNIDRRNKSIVE